MPIRRNPNKDRWILDPNCINDTRLTWKARGILVYLLSKPDDWTVNIRQLIHASPDGRGVVQSALQELQQLGYATREWIQLQSGAMKGTQWIIHEGGENAPVSKTRSSGNPIVGKPDRRKTRSSGNPIVGKPDRRETGLLTYDLNSPSIENAPRIEKEGKERHVVLEQDEIPLTHPQENPTPNTQDIVKTILGYLNVIAGSKYRVSKELSRRLTEGEAIADCLLVIDWYAAVRMEEWCEAAQYFRPSTLFNATKFQEYLGRAKPWHEQGRAKHHNGTSPQEHLVENSTPGPHQWHLLQRKHGQPYCHDCLVPLKQGEFDVAIYESLS